MIIIQLKAMTGINSETRGLRGDPRCLLSSRGRCSRASAALTAFEIRFHKAVSLEIWMAMPPRNDGALSILDRLPAGF